MYLAEGVPAADKEATLFALVGVGEEIDPVAHSDVVQRWVEGEAELVVAFGGDGGDSLVFADVGEAIDGFFQLLFIHVVDADDAVDGGIGELLDIVFTRDRLVIEIKDNGSKERQQEDCCHGAIGLGAVRRRASRSPGAW